MRYKHVISFLILLVIVVNSFILQKKEGLDLGLVKNLVKNVNSSRFECSLATECINMLRYYYFFVAIVYEMISTSNCISRISDIEFRIHLSRKLSELNYYRNYFAEYIIEKGRNVSLFDVTHEFPKRKASFLNVCSQIKYIDAKELYVIEQRVLSNYLIVLLELKMFIYADKNILSESPLFISQKRDVTKIINWAIEIISFTQNVIQEIRKDSRKSKSIYQLSKIPQKLQVIKIYKCYLKVRISHIVKLRYYINVDKKKLLSMLEKLEHSNKMPPKY